MTDAELPEIPVDEAIERSAAGTVLIDVREQDEWDAGHAPDALLVPLSELQSRVDEIPTDQPVLIICHSGGRSLRATSFLRAEGVDAINVVGGMTAWAQVGGPLTANSTEA
ncbi:MAG: rhodanese-like domain-containing protein [Actinobacteria bacterium]|nr:rhodanese-like domain-containing protein [Actinomycetota bacterium]